MKFETIEYKPKKLRPNVGEFLYCKVRGESKYCRVMENNGGVYILEIMPFGGRATDWNTSSGLDAQNKSTVMYNYYKEKS